MTLVKRKENNQEKENDAFFITHKLYLFFKITINLNSYDYKKNQFSELKPQEKYIKTNHILHVTRCMQFIIFIKK